MKINKWNFLTKEYDQVEIPNNRNISLYSNDMNQIIQCVNCGKEIRFGDSYTSRQYHSEMGFGYCVCDQCYKKEWELELKARKIEENV